MTLEELKKELTPNEMKGGLIVDYYNRHNEFDSCAYYDYPDLFIKQVEGVKMDIVITRRNIFNVYIDCFVEDL